MRGVFFCGEKLPPEKLFLRRSDWEHVLHFTGILSLDADGNRRVRGETLLLCWVVEMVWPRSEIESSRYDDLSVRVREGYI